MTMRILFITPYVPSPIRVRSYELVRALVALGAEVTLLCSASAAEAAAAVPLRQLGIDVRLATAGAPQRLAATALGALYGLPLQAAYGAPSGFGSTLRALLLERSFDVVHLEHLRAAALIDELRGLPLVYDAVDCISLLLERTRMAGPTVSSRMLAAIELHRTRRFEAKVCGAASVTVVTSPEDAAALRTIAPGATIEVLPNGVDLERFAPGDGGRNPARIVFSGKMSYHANIAAARRLVERIMPLVWQKCPQAELVIAGSAPPKTVLRYAADARITVTGRVAEIAPYLRAAAVAACPLAYGVGVQNKVLEAMATATPVVVDRQCLTALQAEAGRELLVGADDAEFADALVAVLADRELAQQVGAAGRRYVERFHRWSESALALGNTHRRAAQRSATRIAVDVDAFAGVDARGIPL